VELHARTKTGEKVHLSSGNDETYCGSVVESYLTVVWGDAQPEGPREVHGERISRCTVCYSRK